MVVVDEAGLLPGRGAYLHPDDPVCLARALRRGALRRALRASGPETVEPSFRTGASTGERLH